MGWPILEAFGLIVATVFLLYYYSTIKLDYWRKKGVKGPKPLPFVGNYKDVYLAKISTNDVFTEAYNTFKDEKMVGVYSGHIPFLVLRDLDLIKDVLIKDFGKFANRTMDPIRVAEPLAEQMFRLDPERWRILRTKFSPIFTTGRLKEMFTLMTDCAAQLETLTDKLVEKNEPIECRELAAKYTTDSIAICAFGIQSNALTDEASEFRRICKRVFDTNFKQLLTDRLRDYPLLFKYIARLFIDYQVVDFFMKITKEPMDYRIQNGVHRADFINMLVDIKTNPSKYNIYGLDDLFMSSQSFVFLLAGLENSSLCISHCLYELSKNQPIQDKARTEVQDGLQKSNGEMTYDVVRGMKYIEACLNETLRKYPVIIWLSRTALEDYTFRGTKVSISKGQQVYLPVYAIQNDPDIFPNPQAFDPERFLNQNAKSRHPMSHLPFGDGPRNCIGLRFGMLQMQVALVKLLSKYKFDVCEKTRMEYKMDKKPFFLLQPIDGINLKVSKLDA